MREDNLSPFAPTTTNSRHNWCVVPNLVRGIVLTGLDQLWVADIIYAHLAEEHGYLAVILVKRQSRHQNRAAVLLAA
jgi:putative transposase